MGFLWRLRLSGGSKKEITPVMIWSEPETSQEDITIPPEFQCPISFDLMKDPVITSSGITYDRESIEKWIDSGNKACPVTNTVLITLELIPNHAIRKMIQAWCVEKGSSYGKSGIERIPTPRVPVMPVEVTEICKKLSVATRRGDYKKCGEIVGRIKALGRESERNKKCFTQNGVGLVLCVCFDAFSSDENLSLLEEILSVLMWTISIGSECLLKLATASSFRCIAGLLRSTDDYVRQNAAFVLEKVLSSTMDETEVEAFAEVNGVEEALVRLIRDSISPSSTKSSLKAIYHMVSKKPEIASKFLEIGLVNVVVEMIVDAEKSVCEKALTILDAICETRKGRDEVRKHALVMPLLVKKIPKVSELATRSCVSVMLKLCKTGKTSTIEEAVRLGAFQKVLVVLQVGYGEGTKEKATELLKMINTQMKKMSNDECVDSSMDFKYLNKPF